jgi:hypothetical protein
LLKLCVVVGDDELVARARAAVSERLGRASAALCGLCPPLSERVGSAPTTAMSANKMPTSEGFNQNAFIKLLLK